MKRRIVSMLIFAILGGIIGSTYVSAITLHSFILGAGATLLLVMTIIYSYFCDPRKDNEDE